MNPSDFFKDTNGKQENGKEFRDKMNMQTALTPIVLDHLRDFGMSDGSELRVEFFFYSNNPHESEQLAVALRRLDYDVEVGPSAVGGDKILITGWTRPMKMDDEIFQQWTEAMCKLAYEHGCKFDGWGTTPDQDLI